MRWDGEDDDEEEEGEEEEQDEEEAGEEEEEEEEEDDFSSWSAAFVIGTTLVIKLCQTISSSGTSRSCTRVDSLGISWYFHRRFLWDVKMETT